MVRQLEEPVEDDPTVRISVTPVLEYPEESMREATKRKPEGWAKVGTV